MKKVFSTVVLGVLILFTSCSSDKNKSTDKQEKPGNTSTVTAKAAKTSAHIRVPNSHLYIIPPSGFAANELTGTITTEEGHPDILVMKIISGSTPEKLIGDLKTQADKDYPGSWKEENVSISGHQAKIYHSKGMAGAQYFLAFTDGYTDEMIIVNYDESDIATSKQLYEALKTVIFEN